MPDIAQKYLTKTSKEKAVVKLQSLKAFLQQNLDLINSALKKALLKCKKT